MWRLQGVSMGVMAWAAAVLPTMAEPGAPPEKLAEKPRPALAQSTIGGGAGPLAGPSLSPPSGPSVNVSPGVVAVHSRPPEHQRDQPAIGGADQRAANDQREEHRDRAWQRDARLDWAPSVPSAGNQAGNQYEPAARSGYRRNRASTRDWPISNNRIYRAPRDAYGGRWVYMRPPQRYARAQRYPYAGRGYEARRYRSDDYTFERGPYRPRYRDDARARERYVPRDYRDDQDWQRRASNGDADDSRWDRYPYNVGRRRDF